KGSCVQGLPHNHPTNYRYNIHQDLCTGCGDCLKTNCPAIVKRTVSQPAGGAGGLTMQFEITNECIGCGLCSQTCSEQAILPRTVTLKSRAATKIISKISWHGVIRKARSLPPLRKLLDKFEKEFF